MYYDNDELLAEMKGQVFKKVWKSGEYNDELHFLSDKGTLYTLYHKQDCCETVDIEDICGDLEDLEGFELLQAEESSNSKDVEYGSETWTFYRFATIRGSVVVRWYGESNGYYSESVDMKKEEGYENIL